MEKNHGHPLCLSHLFSVSTATKVTANTGINHLTGSRAVQDAFIVLQIFLSSCPDVKVQIQASCLQCESAHYFFHENSELHQSKCSKEPLKDSIVEM